MNVRSPSHPLIPGFPELKAWLRPLDWGDAELTFLAGDASFRTYFRLRKETESRVLMVAPPEYEKPQEYAHVTELLKQLNLSVPQIFCADFKQGLLLLEDFGDHVYSHCLKIGHDEERLYEMAIDTLIHLHKEKPSPSCLPSYDEEKFIEEVLVFLEWAYPMITGQSPTPEIEASYTKAWVQSYHQLPILPHCVVLRDFMIDNLIWLKGRSGVKSCGLLDFQDALWGDITYDVVSLLEDARRDVPPQLAQRMIERYLKAFPHLSRNTFDQSYFTWGAQRSTKIIGVFTRLAQRDQKTQYLQHLPRIWRILKGDLQHPALRDVKAWFDEHQVWGDI